MITRTSKARQQRLLPVCRWMYCRSVATVNGATCEKHHAEALAMKPGPCPWCDAPMLRGCTCDPDTGKPLPTFGAAQGTV